MKPPNITPPPGDQPQVAQALPPVSSEVVPDPVTNSIPSQSTTAKPPTLVVPQVQQAPLALTTQTTPQQGTQERSPLSNPQLQSLAPLTTQSQTQLQHQPKVQSTHLQATSAATTTTTTIATAPTIIPQPAQPIALAPTTSGPTALVIIPQHSTTTSTTPITKASIISNAKATPITTVGVTPTHVTLPVTTHCPPLQLQAAITTTHVPGIASLPITAHQQATTTPVQSTLANRPPSTLPIVPVTATTTPAPIKSELNKYICCLLDNGIRCDRIAGNASFSARIQKIVGTKKMNFVLDPTVRHTYICEHHKAIITVAKKSTTLARDTKSNARNYTANNKANTLASQANSNFNDLSLRQQQSLQHPVNMELITNQNRLANNHAGVLNNMPMRQGGQLAYSHYQAAHPNQVGPMDDMMSNTFDNVGGDGAPSGSGGVDVDLQQLQVNTLRRYKKHFRVQTRPGLNKLQLAESLKNHFRTLPIIEKEAITYFVYIVKCYRNKLDHNPKAD